MLNQSRDFDESLVMVRPEERPWGLLVHALGWVPIWGFVFNAAIWLYFKNRSREIVFHVQQSIQYQIVVLLPVLAWVICSIFIGIIRNLSLQLGDALQLINTFILISVMTVMGCVALYGAGMVYAGKGFLYPVIGKRVLEGTIRKYTED